MIESVAGSSIYLMNTLHFARDFLAPLFLAFGLRVRFVAVFFPSVFLELFLVLSFGLRACRRPLRDPRLREDVLEPSLNDRERDGLRTFGSASCGMSGRMVVYSSPSRKKSMQMSGKSLCAIISAASVATSHSS
jgi:hypothetical protein